MLTGVPQNDRNAPISAAAIPSTTTADPYPDINFALDSLTGPTRQNLLYALIVLQSAIQRYRGRKLLIRFYDPETLDQRAVRTVATAGKAPSPLILR